MMASGDTRGIADAFWREAGGRERYGCPSNLALAVTISLRIAVVPIPGLTFAMVDKFLRTLGGPQRIPGGDAPLHGLVVADQDAGFIFIDANDASEEQRSTIAHEAAHFLKHYREPRLRALNAFGPQITDVLNRRRRPSAAEQLGSVLRGVPLHCYRHGHQREAGSAGAARRVEDQADLIATEILFPMAELRTRPDLDASSLATEFGVTRQAAETAVYFLRPAPRAPGVIDLLSAGRHRR